MLKNLPETDDIKLVEIKWSLLQFAPNNSESMPLRDSNRAFIDLRTYHMPALPLHLEQDVSLGASHVGKTPARRRVPKYPLRQLRLGFRDDRLVIGGGQEVTLIH